MFRAYGTAPAETPSADLYSWTTPIFNKGAVLDFNCSYSLLRDLRSPRRLSRGGCRNFAQFSRAQFHLASPRRSARVMT